MIYINIQLKANKIGFISKKLKKNEKKTINFEKNQVNMKK